MDPIEYSRPKNTKTRYSPLWKNQSFIFAILLMLLLVVIAKNRLNEYEGMLTGFWVGDLNFLNQAGMSDMFLYLETPDRGHIPFRRITRRGYLVMLDDQGDVISDQPIIIKYRTTLTSTFAAVKSHFRGLGPSGTHRKQTTYRIANCKIDYSERKIMPTGLSLVLNPETSSLILYDSAKIYAFLYRDSQASEATPIRERSY